MQHRIRMIRGFGGNPLAGVLMVVVGLLAMVAAVVLGFFVFIAFAAIVLVLAAIGAVRFWLLKRSLRKDARPGDDLHARRTSSRVIEGEYKVVSTRRDGRPRG